MCVCYIPTPESAPPGHQEHWGGESPVKHERAFVMSREVDSHFGHIAWACYPRLLFQIQNSAGHVCMHVCETVYALCHMHRAEGSRSHSHPALTLPCAIPAGADGPAAHRVPTGPRGRAARGPKEDRDVIQTGRAQGPAQGRGESTLNPFPDPTRSFLSRMGTVPWGAQRVYGIAVSLLWCKISPP